MSAPGASAFLRRALGAALLLAGAAALAAAWAAYSPIGGGAREQEFVIPKGTWARRNAGENVEVLPSTIHLMLEVKDVLVMRNGDDVPQMFGPVLMMPGQSFRLPFGVASSYEFACSGHLSGQLRVVVAPAPAAGWPRLKWRLAALAERAWL